MLLHLMLSRLICSGSKPGSVDWSTAWHNWMNSIVRQGGAPGEADGETYADVTQHDAALIAGIAAYRRHPFSRSEHEPAILWQEGDIRLLDYALDARDPPVVFIPSLINRAYILDLAPPWSMMRFLARHGVRPLLLDWGWPGPAERCLGLADYISGPLDRALGAVDRPAVLAGYCMGGLLAVAAAQRRPERVRGLALLATPWDFRIHDPVQADALAACTAWLEPVLQVSGAVPIDILQALFAMSDPPAVGRKFRAFGRLDQQSERARRFVAVEDWVNDGVPLGAQLARECLRDWYGGNLPARADWWVGGMCVDPRQLDTPSFVAIPGRDRIVPARSAQALATVLRNPHIIEPDAGHVSMIVGRNAEQVLWRPLLEWLRRI